MQQTDITRLEIAVHNLREQLKAAISQASADLTKGHVLIFVDDFNKYFHEVTDNDGILYVTNDCCVINLEQKVDYQEDPLEQEVDYQGDPPLVYGLHPLGLLVDRGYEGNVPFTKLEEIDTDRLIQILKLIVRYPTQFWVDDAYIHIAIEEQPQQWKQTK